jgi:hypothetical protein
VRTIPAEAVQEALHIAYLAGKNGLEQPQLFWIPPKSGTEDHKGNWIINYPSNDKLGDADLEEQQQ